MDENKFFRQATLRICSSLNLQRAMERTLAFLKDYIPADGLFIGLYDPELNIARTLVSIVPDFWPAHPEVITIPRKYWSSWKEEWLSEPDFNVTNDIDEEKPHIRAIMRLLWPEQVSAAHTDLELESLRLGAVVLAAAGKHRYREEHARLLNFLNEPFSIAIANYLQYQETVRLKEMLADDNRYLHRELMQMSGDTIIGADFGLKGVMGMVRQVAPLDSPVLLLGETGVGKEVLANAIHAASPRRDGPFIKVNGGGLPDSLLDSELFGHEKGAFTGAIATKRGRFERADKGTIFLDEIGELPLAAQVKLLRVLQSREIERVGGTRTINVDVRMISATHRNLEEMIRQGKFREDLWFRLNVFPIMIPPLRQRPQDIPALVDYSISRKAAEMKITRPLRLSPGALERLTGLAWPGNVRELENLVERALIQAKGRDNDLLTFDVDPVRNTIHKVYAAPEIGETGISPLDDAIAAHITKALGKTQGKVEGTGGAAELLGLHPSTLRGKMRRLGLSFGKKR